MNYPHTAMVRFPSHCTCTYTLRVNNWNETFSYLMKAAFCCEHEVICSEWHSCWINKKVSSQATSRNNYFLYKNLSSDVARATGCSRGCWMAEADHASRWPVDLLGIAPTHLRRCGMSYRGHVHNFCRVKTTQNYSKLFELVFNTKTHTEVTFKLS